MTKVPASREASRTYSKDSKTWESAANIKHKGGHLSEYQFIRIDWHDGSFTVYDLWRKKDVKVTN